jgi:hypothetical protein
MARSDDPETVVEALPVILATQLFGDDAPDKLMIGPEIDGPVHFNLHWPGGLQIPYKGSPAQETTHGSSCVFLGSSQNRGVSKKGWPTQ